MGGLGYFSHWPTENRLTSQINPWSYDLGIFV